jgi:hypothetical protein
MNIVLIKDKRSMMEGYVQGRRPLENYELAFRRFVRCVYLGMSIPKCGMID